MLSNDEKARLAHMIAQCKQIAATCEVQGRDLNPSELEVTDDLWKKIDFLKLKDERSEPEAGQRHIPMDMSTGGGSHAEQREIFNRFLRGGQGALSQQEQRALSMNLSDQGGYLVNPEYLVPELIKQLRDDLPVFDLCRRFEVPKAVGLGVPVLTDAGDPTWTSELLTGADDSTMALGKRELFPHPLARSIKVSNKLLSASLLNPEEIVMESFRYRSANVVENSILNGTGANQPLGVFVPSAMGVSVARNVTSTVTAGLSADDLITLKYTLKAAYLRSPSLRWILHRNTLATIRKLKDGDGQYIWRQGLASDKADTILDVPYIMSEYAPSAAPASGGYCLALTDLQFYWIAIAQNIGIQRVDQLYALTNQCCFIARMEVDGAPVLEDATVRLVYK